MAPRSVQPLNSSFLLPPDSSNEEYGSPPYCSLEESGSKKNPVVDSTTLRAGAFGAGLFTCTNYGLNLMVFTFPKEF